MTPKVCCSADAHYNTTHHLWWSDAWSHSISTSRM